MVAIAIVGARLDYCNALFSDMSEPNSERLLQVQNSLARVVVGSHVGNYIKPVLVQLHWLPIRARVTFNIAILVFKIRRTYQPCYLSNMIEECKMQRTLRFSFQLLLYEPTFRTATGRRTWRYVDAKTWNRLPETRKKRDIIGSFKRQMKTMLFRQSYCTYMISQLLHPRVASLATHGA